MLSSQSIMMRKYETAIVRLMKPLVIKYKSRISAFQGIYVQITYEDPFSLMLFILIFTPFSSLFRHKSTQLYIGYPTFPIGHPMFVAQIFGNICYIEITFSS